MDEGALDVGTEELAIAEADETLTMAVMDPGGGARTPSIDICPEASDWRSRGSDFFRNGTRYGCGLKETNID